MADRRRPMTLCVAILMAIALVLPSRTGAIVFGGGSPKTDCLSVFNAAANYPVSRPKSIRCVDGDPCDVDGEVNGSCQFQVGVCANDPGDGRCTLVGVGVQSITVDHALDDGDRKFDPEFQALQSRIDNAIDPPTTDSSCTTPTNMHVPVQGPFAGNSCKRGRKDIRLTAISQPSGGKLYKDKDKFQLVCDPAPVGCDPADLYDGTFDRIQRQIFNQTCAVSGCHDSQSQAGDMILEVGASYGNLVDATPDNSVAAAAGWKRVMTTGPSSGDPNTSFIYHKLTGDLDPGMGQRMPLVGPSLDPTLIEIIRLWIEAGAPATGWVAGTD
jgi:hypothetical protein